MPPTVETSNIKPHDFYDKSAFAEILKKSIYTVDRIVMRREIRYCRDGGRLLFKGTDILRFLERNAVEAR